MNRSNETQSDKRVSATTDRNTGGNLPDARIDASRKEGTESKQRTQGRDPSAPTTISADSKSERPSHGAAGPFKH